MTKPTIEELESAKTWVDMRKLDDNSPQMVAIIDALSYALTQALEIAKGDKVVPVYQTEFGERGNCMSACLASILGIPLKEFPNFYDMGTTERQWWNALKSWLESLNIGIVTTNLRGALLASQKGFMIVGGMTTDRNLEHAVVYKDGALWHDPHPEGKGLTEITGVDILFPLNPSKPFGRFTMITAAQEERRPTKLKCRKRKGRLRKMKYGVQANNGISLRCILLQRK